MTESLKFDIKPFIGALPLEFGATPEISHNILGDPSSSRIADDDNYLQEFFNDYPMNIGYTAGEHKLFHIGFSRRNNNVFFDGVNLFISSEEEVIRKLMEHDNFPYEGLGFIIFLKLGVVLSGFHDGDLDQKAVTVSNDIQYWNSIIDELEPFIIEKYF